MQWEGKSGLLLSMQPTKLKREIFRLSGREIAVCLVIVVAVLWVYRQVGQFEFVRFDDTDYITENPYVRTGLRLENLRWAIFSAHSANWHPVTWFSHMIDCQLFGLDPGAHHLVNLFFHAVNALLVYVVFTCMTGCPWKTGFVALAFAVHPLHVESVAWVAERKDLLCAFFWMLTLWAYLSYVEQPGPGRYSTMILLFILGLMSKPMIVTLPFVLLLLDFWPLKRFETARRNGGLRALFGLVAEKAPLLLLTAGASLVTLHVQNRAGAVGSVETFPVGARISNALVAYKTYLVKMAWPADLACLYPFVGSVEISQVILAAVALVFLTGLAVVAARHHAYFTVGWFWYLGTLVPVIGLVQIGLQARADRYTYLPMIGVWIILAWGGERILDRMRRCRTVAAVIAGAAVAGLLIAWAVTARMQVGYWKDSGSLFGRALAVTAGNYAAHNNLGLALAEKGETRAAMEQYREALRIMPGFAKAHNNLALLYEEQGRLDQAAHHYARALALDPRLAGAHYNFGRILQQRGEAARAMQHYTAAVEIDDDLAAAHFNLGNILAEQGRLEAATDRFEKALKANPGHTGALHHLGNVLLARGRVRSAADRFLAVLQHDPDNADAHNNLGIAMIRLGKLERGIFHLKRALRLNPGNREIRHNLEKAQNLRKREASATGRPEGVLTPEGEVR